MSDLLGNNNATGPYPGHEALYQKILLISRTRLSEIFTKAVTLTDKMLSEICKQELLNQDRSAIGSDNLENYKQFKSASNRLEINFKYAVEQRFLEFKKQLNYKSTAAATVQLQLIDMNDMEDVVISELIAEAILRKFAAPISNTNRRFCTLFGLQESDLSKAPLTEKSLIDFLRVALQELELPSKVCALIYRNYEIVLFECINEFYAMVNEPMIAAGILPQLQIQNLASKPQFIQNQNRDENARTVNVDSIVSNNSQSEFQQNDKSTWSQSDLPINKFDHALFEELCNYLHTWRPQNNQSSEASVSNKSNQGSTRSRPRQELATHQMISVLSALQAALPDRIASSMQGGETSISKMMKFEMANSAQKIGLPVDAYEINRDDEDAVDLVGMLFDVLASERDFRDEAKVMMSRLVVPYTKAAVLDKRLFLTKAHPARKLLNALTEAVEGNKGDGPQDRELLNKAESTVDRLVADFNEDIAIFELLEQEMRTHMDQHKRRIDLAEKRAKEAQRGQERLENARMLAARELEVQTQNIVLPPAIQDFFARYWTHHLSMISLRDGEDSLAWSSAIQLAQDIIKILHSLPPEARSESLFLKRPMMEIVFSSSGVLSEASRAIIQNIAETATKYQTTNPKQNDIDSMATKQPVISESALHLAFNKDALDYDNNDVAYFKSLEIGAWLQLEDGKGSFTPIKLAWVSPISSRLMFVNRRGVRVLVVSVEELAQMKKQAKLIVHDKENVFDQTLDRVLDRLKSDLA